MLPSWLPINVESPDVNVVSVAIVVADVRIAQELERKRGLAVVVVWLLILVVFMLTVFTDDGVPEVIEARQFLLRDSNGTIRAGLVIEQNEPILFFADTSGKRISQYK